uniref:Protein-tyrosine phosphatase n=1 Tax=Heterorhabditis bacteriophora TaxID=37862 RepID=A0A1I7XGN4_HETBA
MLHFCLVAAATIPIYLIFLCAKPKKTSKESKSKVHKLSAKAQNQPYTDVLCLDATRVVIKGRDKDDYIHASWIHVPDNSCRYICTQGPLTETLEDFWAMVFQEKTKFVVMLCNIIEGGAEKCVLYWPEKNGQIENYGAYLVKNVEVKPDPVEGVRWSLLDIIYKEEIFQVYHVFVTWWPDQLAPIDPAPMVNLYKWVKRLNEKDHPILVHCSAGVGRTATFVGLSVRNKYGVRNSYLFKDMNDGFIVGIDYANVRIRENANTDLIDVIKEMRAQRYQSIQSHVQYLFLHICLLEYFIQK